ncbi:B box zinc finger [Trypanosoma vivax]|uniref:B box-type domain-containing protein n=1 Tax=Trypanosoma vivax (strain Y486) TaxID=1055687 RepID=G0U6N6_TRYVY|nr:B box zinc finger [Trypanosoma vivax]CCC51540.1 conserved hypothetical protein [Trypanosoma vivax Y486]
MEPQRGSLSPASSYLLVDVEPRSQHAHSSESGRTVSGAVPGASDVELAPTDVGCGRSPQHCTVQRCPICFHCGMEQPVLLHPVAKEQGENCFACSYCAEKWLQLLASSKTVLAMPCPRCSALVSPDCTVAHHASVSFTLQTQPRTCAGSAKGILSGGPLPALRTDGSAGMVPSEEGVETCRVCEKANSIESCGHCGCPLCETSCISGHQCSICRSQQTIKCDRAQEPASTKCLVHTTQILNLYCLTCSVCVCVGCVFGGIHKGHNIEPLVDVARDIRLQMMGKGEELQQVMMEMQQLTTVLEGQLLARCDSIVRTGEDDVKRCFDAMRLALEHKEQRMLESMASNALNLRQNISSLAQQCEAAHVMVLHTLKNLENFVATTLDEDVVPAKDMVLKSTLAVRDASVRVLASSNEEIRVLQERLTRFGTSTLMTVKEQEGFAKILDRLQPSSSLPATATRVSRPPQEVSTSSMPSLEISLKPLKASASLRQVSAPYSCPLLKLDWEDKANELKGADDICLRDTVRSLTAAETGTLIAPLNERVVNVMRDRKPLRRGRDSEGGSPGGPSQPTQRRKR